MNSENDINNSEVVDSAFESFDSAFEKALGAEMPDTETPPAKETPKETPATEKQVSTETPNTTEITPKIETPKEGLKAPPGGTNESPKEKPAASPSKDSEIEAIQPPKNISPRNLEGWNALKSKALERGEQVQQLTKQLEEFKAKGGTVDPALQERLKAAEAEAARFRTIYTNERDPGFIAKYDTKIESNEGSVLDILKRGGMNDANLETIKKLGINGVPDAFWREHVLPNVSIVEAKQIENALSDTAKLKQDRKTELESIGTNFQKYEEEQKQKHVQSFETYRGEMNQTLQNLTSDLPWCRLQEVPTNATPEQKELIEKQNEFYQQSEQRFSAALFPPSASARVEVAFAACLSYKLAEDLQAESRRAEAAEKRATEAEAKIASIKSAGVTNNAGKNIPKTATNKDPLSDKLKMKNDDAIEAGLQEVGA